LEGRYAEEATNKYSLRHGEISKDYLKSPWLKWLKFYFNLLCLNTAF
jgi:hypothetical protein